jgi:NAD(P)-dependent dehydrogenase (short-subunit alcohol dehydrogenase family)
MNSDSILDLGGQAALVTGAGQGAGRAIALMLARHGGAVQADVSDIESVRAMAAKASAELGPLTILVNNAGMAGPTAQLRPRDQFWDEDPVEWGKYLGTNLYGVFNCCHALMPGMVDAKRGRIVTITSDAGRVGEPRQAVYSAAKAGAAGFMRSIAKEGGRHGITANSIALSSLEFPMSEEEKEKFYQLDQIKAQLSRYVIRRYGKPDEVAALALFLCSDVAGWITGQTYPLNGGYSFAV